MINYISIKRYSVLLFILALLGHIKVCGQGYSNFDVVNKISSYYPVSVNASQLFQKPPEQIDYATGRATIRIPLYEIRTKDFTLPISIYYVTGGIKVDQLTGNIGLGWQLDAEPMITRSVRGRPDEYSFLKDSLLKRTYERYNTRVATGQADIQEDVFYYRTLNHNGKFMLKESAKLMFKPTLLTDVPLKITSAPIINDLSNPLYLKDPSGNSYVFGGSANARETTFQGGETCVTNWKASYITSPDGDFVSFNYLNKPAIEYPSSRYDFYAVEDQFYNNMIPGGNVPPHPGFWKGVNGKMNYYYVEGTKTDSIGRFCPILKLWDKVRDKPYNQPGSRINTHPLSRINFNGGSVRFIYNSDSTLLQKVEVFSGETLVKRILLKTSQTDTKTNRYFLDEVVFCSPDNATVERYKFDYHPANAYDRTNKDVDYWGYFSGWYTGNTDLVAKQDIYMDHSSGRPMYLSVGGALTKYNKGEGKMSYNLRKVTYPSGGTTEYIYDSHRTWLSDFTNSCQAGGARLFGISDNPQVGTRTTRHFYYGSDLAFDGVGYSRFPVHPSSFMKETRKHYIIPQAGYGIEYSGRLRVYSNMTDITSDTNIYYPCVAEEVNGMRTVRWFANRVQKPDGMGPNIVERIGNSELLSREDSCMLFLNSIPIQQTKNTSNQKMGSIKEVKHFATFENYAGSPEEYYLMSPSVQNLYNSSYVDSYMDIVNLEPGIAMSQAKANMNKNPITRTEYRSYDSNRNMTSMRSDNEEIEYSYPNSYSGGVYDKMRSNNDHDHPIQMCHYINGNLKKRVNYNYALNSSTSRGYSLSSISESTSAVGNDRILETYGEYLRCGQPSQMTRMDNTIISIVWAYGGKYPIAIVEGLTAATLRSAGINLSQLEDSHTIAESVYTTIENLRKTYPDARITTYRYQPMVGIVCKNDPDGIATRYEYDPAGRLSQVKDNQLKTLLKYEYHEVNK